LNDLSKIPESSKPEISNELSILKNLHKKLDDLVNLSKEERLNLYHRIRWLTRTAAFKNPLLDSERIVFMKRRRFICQMLHEYMGYYWH